MPAESIRGGGGGWGGEEISLHDAIFLTYDTKVCHGRCQLQSLIIYDMGLIFRLP